MRARIHFNEFYTKHLMNNSNLMDSLITVNDENDFITEFWIENHVLDNNEFSFRFQLLNLIKNSFTTAFNVESNNVEIANDENNDLPTFLIRSTVAQNQRLIASIIDFEL